jgi:hypothetical protein
VATLVHPFKSFVSADIPYFKSKHVVECSEITHAIRVHYRLQFKCMASNNCTFKIDSLILSTLSHELCTV